MKVVVLDWNFKFIETFDGGYLNGVLVHKRGERKYGILGMTLFKTGGKLEEMEFDYHKTIDFGRERLALYQWDGKNLHQLSFFDVPESSTLVDYKNSWEIAKLTEETVLKPPENTLMKYAMGLWAIVVIISGVALVYATNHVVNDYNQLAVKVPVVNITQQNAEAFTYLIKADNRTSVQDSEIISVLQNVTRYISTH